MGESDSDDDLVSYGTPLEPLEEDEIPTKKPRLLEDQVVTDSQGRRRFHGAFTGGFSAGFFNTVGSLEGWLPAAFKSSRSKKRKVSSQRPEDFMDEEDLSEFGIAPLVLKAKQDYTDEIRKKVSNFADAPTLGSYVLKDLLKPARDTIGIKLLKKMGWKPGQGVGPRLNKSEKQATAKIRQRAYGCQLPPGSQEDSNSDSDYEDIQFAPNDYELVLCDARDNSFGIGYEGLDKRPILSAGPGVKPNFQDKTKKVGFGSQAFGVGAFEEEDEDIYARDDMSRYDFALGTDPSAKETTVAATAEGVLEGFVLATKRPPQKHYPLPVLPREFKARHRIRKSRFDQPPAEKESLVKKQKLNFEERGKLVGEELEAEKQIQQKKQELVKELVADVKISASKFRPFANNPEKQERYENYLKLVQIGKTDRLVDLQPASLTSWDKEREKVEFDKAAALFKPLSGGMEDRFATASQPDDLSDPLAVVEKFHDENDDRRKAAKMKMYGPLTRTTEDWTPCQLLCKRFNIPEPRKEEIPRPEKKKKSSFSLFENLDYQKQRISEEAVEKPNIEKDPEPEPESQPVSKEDNLQKIQDKTDLFKAIFLASDDEEEQTKEEFDVERETVDEKSYEETVINSKRNLSPPRGIFETLDLDLLSGKRKPVMQVEKKVEKPSIEVPKPKEVEPVQDLVYGPKIPEKVVKINRELKQESDDELWVEKKAKGKKNKKKDKKEKKSHKSKHKHKKHKR